MGSLKDSFLGRGWGEGRISGVAQHTLLSSGTLYANDSKEPSTRKVFLGAAGGLEFGAWGLQSCTYLFRGVNEHPAA